MLWEIWEKIPIKNIRYKCEKKCVKKNVARLRCQILYECTESIQAKMVSLNYRWNWAVANSIAFPFPFISRPKSLNARFNRRAQSEDYYFSPQRFAFFSRYGRYVEINRIIIEPRRNFVRISWPNDTQCKTARHYRWPLMIQRTLMKLSRHVDYIPLSIHTHIFHYNNDKLLFSSCVDLKNNIKNLIYTHILSLLLKQI